MGSFEYSQTSFSYSINETGEENFVGIAAEPMAPLASTGWKSPWPLATEN